MGGRGASSGRGGGGGVGRIQNSTIGKPNDATEYYVSGEGMWINQYLRGDRGLGELSENERRYLRDLDEATSGVISDNKLYRSTDASVIFGDMTASQYENLVSRMVYGDDSRLVKNSTDKLLDGAKGKTITEKGFMSTTSNRGVAEEWGGFSGSDKPVVMEITTSRKTRGVDLSSYDKNVPKSEAQHERLLARGQSYTVDNVTAKNGNIVVQVTMKG